MQKPNINVVIFDDDQEPVGKNQIKKYTSQTKNIKPSISNGHNSQKNIKKNIQNDKISIISKQIIDLQSKIKNLQKDGEKIRFQLQKKAGSNQIGVGNNSNSNKIKQFEQVLMIVERKIQLIIQQSKKLISKMSETVDKKLIQLQKQQHNQKIKIQNVNDKNKNKMNQIQSILRQKLQEYQKHYRNEYQKLVKQSKRKQQIMMKKLSQMELKFSNKLNSFQTKQKQYVDWIHHLQAKLKQKKSKKMITITQEKPQITPIPSKTSIPSNQNVYNPTPLESIPSANFQNSKVNCSIDQNNSKIIRKHKIFGGGGKSTSPNPRSNSNVSPTKDSVFPQQKISNNLQIQPSGSSFYQQNSKVGGNSNLNFYNELKRQQSDKLRLNANHHEEGWDKFADLNEFNEQYTQSESDDFFTPIDAPESNTNYERVLANIPLDSRGGTYYGQPFKSQRSYENNFGYQQSGDKVFSPFDLN